MCLKGTSVGKTVDIQISAHAGFYKEEEETKTEV
jgi:hypothetical protein